MSVQVYSGMHPRSSKAVPGMSLHWPQVFGEVTKGMDVVKSVESYGSQSGARYVGMQHDLMLSLLLYNSTLRQQEAPRSSACCSCTPA